MQQRLNGPLTRLYWCWLPGLVRGNEQSTIIRAMKPRSGSASLAETSLYYNKQFFDLASGLSSTAVTWFISSTGMHGQDSAYARPSPSGRRPARLPWSGLGRPHKEEHD